jgi:tRNA threonylcarbamoyladenosine biosynthesis protein TsaB
VYCMLLDDNLSEVEPTKAKIIDAHSFENYLSEKVIYFIGEGAVKCKEIISHSNARFVTEVNPRATRLGELGYEKWNQSAFEDVVSFEPFYLKDFLIRKPNLV